MEVTTLKKVFLLLAICVLGYPSVGYSLEWLDNSVQKMEENLDKGSVMGVGVLYLERPYIGVDNDTYVVPLVKAEYKRLFIDKTIMGYNLIDDDNLKFSVVTGPHFAGYKSSDSSELAGMEDREWGFDGGLRLKWKTELVDVTATGLTDLSGTYEGQEASVILSKELFKGFLTPSLGAVWSSEDAVDYYYGVRASEARAGRPAYAGEDTFNYLAGLTVAVPLGEKWAMVGDVQHQILGDGVKDSPLVEEDGLFRSTVGTVYRF